jgi:hypothetical protein
MADHIYDETHSEVLVNRLRPGEIIFIATHLAGDFFCNYGSRIDVPYTIITHNSDMAVGKALISLMSRNVLAWFAQNNTYAHERVIPIPIGLENLHHLRAGIPAKFTALGQGPTRTKNRILVSFKIATNKEERTRIYHVASQAACAECLPMWLDQDTYLRTLSEYRFVLSPPGNGLDTHRTWEAMYLGVIPVVGDSVAMRSFEALGLPVWILRNWDDLRAIREEELDAKYEQWRPRFSNPALYLEYWQRRFIECGQTRHTPARTLTPAA